MRRSWCGCSARLRARAGCAWWSGRRCRSPGKPLRAAWLKTAGEIADIYATADPKARLKWAGPDMSARSSITARLMETWAHGQEVYDHLGVERDRS